MHTRSGIDAVVFADTEECLARNRDAGREERFTRIVALFSATGLVVFLLVRPEIDRERFNLVVIGSSGMPQQFASGLC